MEFLILPEDVIHPFDRTYLGGFELRIAAGDDEDGLRVLSPDAMNDLPIFVIGSIRHGAGVDDAYICFFSLFGPRMTAFQQRFSQGTALRKIQFAS